MRKILPNNARTLRRLGKMPKIYAIGCWAGFGVRGYYFSGKFAADGITPLVWDYEDCNGTCDEWRLRNIYHATTGRIYGWSNNMAVAQHIADQMNIARGEEWRVRK